MSIPATMRAVLLTGHGGLDRLEYREDVPVPVPGADEVLVEVSACGMNTTDINTRTGWYATDPQEPLRDGSWGGAMSFPRIQGADPVGRIVVTGAEVDPSRIGQRVLIDSWLRDLTGRLAGAAYLGSERDGGYAEYVAVPARNAHPIDSELTDVQLAGFPCSSATAEHMLTRAAVSAGQWVLVTGASGGVGSALIQLAKLRTARVAALTTAAKRTRVEELGADLVLDRTAADLGAAILDATAGGVDVFADTVGGPRFSELFGTLRPGGHYVVAGAIAGPVVPLDLRTLYLRDVTMHGATVVPPEVFARLVDTIERGDLRPLVAATFPLDRLAEAQSAFLQKRHIGNFVIEVAR